MTFRGGYLPDPLGLLTKLVVAQAEADRAAADAAAAMVRANNAMTKANGADSKATDAATRVVTLAELAADYQAALAASLADRQGMHAQIDALLARAVTDQVAQAAALAAVLVNATGSLTFTWPTPWPDTNYQPVLVSPLRVSAVTYAKTTTTCTVTYKATVAVALGALFNLAAVRLG